MGQARCQTHSTEPEPGGWRPLGTASPGPAAGPGAAGSIGRETGRRGRSPEQPLPQGSASPGLQPPCPPQARWRLSSTTPAASRAQPGATRPQRGDARAGGPLSGRHRPLSPATVLAYTATTLANEKLIFYCLGPAWLPCTCSGEALLLRTLKAHRQ